jgi:hypothetical protein
MVNSFHLSDEALFAMGASWPCHEVINISDGLTQAAPSDITLRGLILLGNKCPLLRSPHPVINANVLKGMAEYSASTVGANDLYNVVLVDITVQNPSVRSYCLSDLPEGEGESGGCYSFDYKHH